MFTNSDLRSVLSRWALRVVVVVGLAFVYQSWSAEPHPWLWQLVAFYSVVMLAVLLLAWRLRKRKAQE
ncbi:hypothetical protein PARPLA_02128 [Rhodobacteraceae bacterium THAF1]|nr:hypothetical protein FIU81_04045 [Palleronia sp. THAF1]VDC25670.1 hypothetical protein PARPLA_02128 [Rhodobacteraceae bacterium THAF1]